jgi:succinate dehydrogenase (ubiquinone) flavoprotein subunit
MARYAPTAKDLASRDVVSRAEILEIREGRGVGPNKDHIYLHLDHLPPELLHEKLPGISETAKIFAGVDVTKEPIPVLPTVHYNMGGIPTNWKTEVLNPTEKDPHGNVVPGLYAAGEAACSSVHGANRLGANSLLDLVVFGRTAAETIAEKLKPNMPPQTLPKDAGHYSVGRVDRILTNPGVEKDGIPTSKLRQRLQDTMQKYAPVYRNTADLKKGAEAIYDEVRDYKHVCVKDKGLIWNTDLYEAMELENLISNGAQLMISAENRKESRGAHALEEFPDRNDKEWMLHTISHQTAPEIENAKIKLSYRPVIDQPLDDEMHHVPPAKRVY